MSNNFLKRKVYPSIFLFFAGVLLLLFSNVYQTWKISFFIVGFTLTFSGMLILRQFWPSRWRIGYVLIFGISARALLFPVTPSDDLNRHAWEAYIQLHGMNPYVTAPDNPATEPLRNEIWAGINHKEFTSIYGPLSQMLFKTVMFFWYSPFGIKLIVMIFDIMSVLLLALFLKDRGSRINELLLYAINPLVLYSFAAEGHLEAIIVFMLAASAVLYQRKKYRWMFFFLGCACAVKLTSIIYVPLFIRKDTLKFTPFVLIPVLFALPYGIDILSIVDVTVRFAREFRFNGLLFSMFALFFDNDTALKISTLLFGTLFLWIFFLTPNPVKACRNASVAFLLSAPTTHSWYFTIPAMFAVLFPSRPLIILTGTMGFGWLTIFNYWAHGRWIECWYIPVLEYLTPLLPDLYVRRKLPGSDFNLSLNDERISIIIPVLNESQQLQDCLESIHIPENTHSEILVVDGGSHDTTLDIAKADPRVRIIQTSKGRGIQISGGIEKASGDLIIILHADSRLDTTAVSHIIQFCKQHPHIAGGSVASRFESTELRFRFITALNTIRSRWTGISFGDQVQFFRKNVLINNLPKVKIMEDIEISLRLKENGPMALLPPIAKSSTRRWEKRNYTRNMFTVIGLTGLYLFKRRLGLLSSDNSEFYKAYYEKT